MFHDPSFQYVKLMMKPTPDYEGKTFRVNQPKRYTPIAPFGVDGGSGGTGGSENDHRPIFKGNKSPDLLSKNGHNNDRSFTVLSSASHDSAATIYSNGWPSPTPQHDDKQIRQLSKPDKNSKHRNENFIHHDGILSWSIPDLQQAKAEMGTSVITCEVEVAIRRLYLRMQTQHNNINANVLMNVFHSVWEDFYPGGCVGVAGISFLVVC